MINDSAAPAKIRAGRALLGLTQGELAELCGFNRTTIMNLEVDCTKARQKTLDILSEFFENSGIKFNQFGNKLFVEANMLEII
jgi:DNA-binding XRE family transcriptional regulator